MTTYGSTASTRDNGEGEQAVVEAEEDKGSARLIASSIGMLADSYDLFAIDLALLCFELVYGVELIGVAERSLIVTSMLAGTIIGQLTFGYVCDWIGRRHASLLTAGLTIAGALMCASVQPTQLDSGNGFGICRQLALCRFCLGLGVGGEYPVTAAASCEISNNPEKRGTYMAGTISMQGWGMLLSSAVAGTCIAVGANLETTWRILLGFGALPSMVAFLLRWRLRESPSYAAAREVSRREGTSRPQFSEILAYSHVLVGTGSCWFLMNFSLYSLGSFKSSIVGKVMSFDGVSGEMHVAKMAMFSALTSVFAIVGFSAAIANINTLGRFKMQLYGFQALTVTFALLVLTSTRLHDNTGLLVWLFGQMFFFQNFGPNTTTYIIAAEAYPTRVRATCHGMSAASGKCGALLGSFILSPMGAAVGMWGMYVACFCSALTGVVMTYYFTPRLSSAADRKTMEDSEMPRSTH